MASDNSLACLCQKPLGHQIQLKLELVTKAHTVAYPCDMYTQQGAY